MSVDYNKTINLPKTEFSMRGNLPKKEPEMLSNWDENNLYYEIVKKNKGKTPYVLHDGPPYANGDIHLGTALNKVLKDIIVKYKNMNGFCADYIPGWDTHGLPIELKAMKEIGVENGAIPPLELRKHCKDYALSYVESQKNQFKRLGVLGDFNNPYLTLKPEFEGKQVKVFGEMAKKGYIYKGLKPVYWCPECQTALAEAEIEYADDPCTSIYVKFKVVDDKGLFSNIGLSLDNTYFVIWTTTTWTLPGNLAICLGPDFEYSVIKVNGENYVIATQLIGEVLKATDIKDYEVIATFKGSELELIKTAHPFFDRLSPVILGNHVTLESGTGCVHTAPGFGVDDFEVCKKYPEIPIIVPVDGKGILTEEAGQFAGLTTDQANKEIFACLVEKNALFASEKITHQYPHCWRCKSPILFRATQQWFCSVEGFKDEAIKAIEDVQWIPAWGEERIKNMVKDRSDWCISRQRTWGVPIPVLYCKDCGKPIIDADLIDNIADLFTKRGSDAWYEIDASEVAPKGLKCECGCSSFEKEMDIMDVWFDSGVTHTSVMDERGLGKVADLYLEGADQYRGWFQSSLLTSVVWQGVAPYKAVCTHGWVVDGQGKTMHKSLGNGIEPREITDKFGADILRLWVASSDYHSDIRISNELLLQLSEAYKKIRNTARYILGNLYNGDESEVFNPEKDTVCVEQMSEIDKYALMKFNNLIEKVKKAYDNFDFHIVFHSIHQFCVVEMSNFYLDCIKDRLYCDGTNSVERKSAQTVIYTILSGISRLLAPIMSFTAEEIWKYLPHSSSDDVNSIYLNEMPTKIELSVNEEFISRWETIYNLREDVKKALEIKRADKIIGSSLEADVQILCDENAYSLIKDLSEKINLANVFIVSNLTISSGKDGEFTGDFAGISINIEKSEGEKCERCWTYSKSVGEDKNHPTLCARCAKVIG